MLFGQELYDDSACLQVDLCAQADISGPDIYVWRVDLCCDDDMVPCICCVRV